MAISTWQADTRHGQYGMLRRRYKGDPNTLVAMNLALYFTAGKPSDMVAPDILVSHGVPDHDRDSYNLWVEGKAPDFALEVSGENSFRHDLGPKMGIYAGLGIPEYCVYDPRGGLYLPRLQLFRLAGDDAGAYERVKGREDADGSLAVPSESLGLELRFEDDSLRLWDPAAQDYLLDSVWECNQQRKERAGWPEERAGHMREHAKRVAAEERIAKLKLELADIKERLRKRRQRNVP